MKLVEDPIAAMRMEIAQERAECEATEEALLQLSEGMHSVQLRLPFAGNAVSAAM